MASSNIPLSSQLKLTNNIAAEWNRFKSQWNNYEVAADLSELSSKKRAVTFLACVGSEGYELFQSMEFTEGVRENIDKVIEAFQHHCVGEVNITYERYVLNRRVQEMREPFYTFMANVRRLARFCDYGDLEDSIVRDRIVFGVRDDATRRMILQSRKLHLKTAIDICRASEVATRQLNVMSASDDVNRLET